MFGWFYRCAPGLSIFLVITVIVFAFSTPTPSLAGCSFKQVSRSSLYLPAQCLAGLTLSQVLLLAYTLITHITLLTFGIKLSWSLHHVTKGIKAVRRARELGIDPSGKKQQLPHDAHTRSMHTLDECLDEDFEYHGSDAQLLGKEVIHAVIVPNYMEDAATLKTTLAVLASHPRAATQYEIYLAMEQREPHVHAKASLLEKEMQTSFRNIESTFHPAGVPGEIAGKSSNVSFAARKIFQNYQNHPDADNVIITVIDCDSHLLQDFFNEIRRYHITSPSTAHIQFYISPFVFDRNAHASPVFVRCSDLLWCWAGLSSLHPGASISIPTSVYSLPLVLASRVGGWDADPTAIGEDMHMLLKTYFGCQGDIITKTIYSAASQCNVSSSLRNGSYWATYYDTLCARYDQALRHMWGALDTGFALQNTIRHRPKLRMNFFALWSLMWQAHFLSGHLLIMVLGTSVYSQVAPAANIHPALTYAFWLSARMRDASFVTMNVAFTFYHWYHEACVEARRRDMAHIENVGDFSRRTWAPAFFADRILFPVAGILFGSLPMMQAVISHFWTTRLVYRVSKKPSFG
ncbi:hypothetical protein K402DRAFT_455224 [Aulographum hederae CBS 113979]|uniref:Glycosyltransferase 2-like domain-containing protein n=1 Tax=Aulographum hederae CBS 113979 TaxID=1176131 RepID=A0A6G1GWY9_9PEZI|nr:hypothetical protein K402DRAFT_455224 [Aulographum hederae CBS 113979]